MARSHPPTLITLVTRALREECGVTRGTRVLLALSGGGDSMALLHVLAILSKKQGFSLFAHGVDHGLRAEAAAELDRAQAQCEALGVAFTRTVLALTEGGNLQARARDARRAALIAIAEAQGAERIATAHHADDRAETVLLRLLRGAGPRGLSVLGPRTGVWIRPQGRARKSDVVAHLTRHHLAFADDPSNLNRRFLRTRVRYELLPLLEQLSPQIVAHLCALADALAVAPEGGSVHGLHAHSPQPALPALARPLPEFDNEGVALLLNRAQRLLVGRARTLGQRSARVSLAHGRELSLDPVTLEPQISVARPRPRKR